MNRQELLEQAKGLRMSQRTKSTIRVHYPELYEYLNNNYPEDLPFVEKIYWFVNGIEKRPGCKMCGKPTRFNGNTYGYKTYCCPKCSNSDPDSVTKCKKTKLERYGSENYNNHAKTEITKEQKYGHKNYNNRVKCKQTNIERYGFDNPMKNKEVSGQMHQTKLERYGDENFTNQEKGKKTKLKRYGNEHFTNPEKIKKTKLERYGDEHYTNREKSRQTCLERYGFDTPLKSPEIQERYSQIKLERYGHPHYSNWEQGRKTNLEHNGPEFVFGTPEYQERSAQIKLERYGHPHYSNWEQGRKTNLERYGVDHIFKSLTIRDQIKRTCLERYGDENYHNAEKVSQTRRKHNIEQIDFLLGYTEDGQWICKCPYPECNKCEEKNFVISCGTYHDRIRNGTVLCTRLLPFDPEKSKNTGLEQFVKEILDNYNIEYKTNVRNVISPKELDIYIPSKNIAFECNGVFWHSINWKEGNDKYQINKFKACQEQGVQLISIWEDWIKNKPEIVKSLVKSKLGIYDQSIYARKCEIREIDSKTCNSFLEANHIQGRTNSMVKIGLFFKNELVSVMTFGYKRSCSGNNSIKEQWELSRFCNKLNTHIVGGASRLLTYFKRKYKPDTIISFSSNDISNGDLYKTLGFFKTDETSAYWYVSYNNMQRFHRSNFTKARLKQMGYETEGKTEEEIMKQLPFFKIYDTGHVKWIWNKQ